MAESDYYLGFSLVNGIGSKTFLTLLFSFKSAEKAWNSNTKEIDSQVGILLSIMEIKGIIKNSDGLFQVTP